jgi:hypothetical protein
MNKYTETTHYADGSPSTTRELTKQEIAQMFTELETTDETPTAN